VIDDHLRVVHLSGLPPNGGWFVCRIGKAATARINTRMATLEATEFSHVKVGYPGEATDCNGCRRR